jgi:hypothetical protein
MANYSQQIIGGHFNNCDNGASNQVRGKAYEDLACYIFETVPGVDIVMRNEKNVFQTEEIDVAIWNDRTADGLHFLPNLFLIECKNWSHPVSSIEVSWFCHKLESRGLDFGILISNHGITGNAEDLTAAHSIVANHLSKKRRMIVIDRQEINNLNTTDELVALIKMKLCLLAVAGRIA